jgi:arylsulfatase A-like enzyme
MLGRRLGERHGYTVHSTALVCVALLLSLVFNSRADASDRPPNILMILTDDQGWGDLGAHGNTTIETPVLDRLAQTGTRFDHFYVSPVCAPTRASMLTGRYHLRTNVTGVTGGREVMNAEEVTLAEVLRDAGYATGCFGKWHNGGHYPHDPNGQGFDEFFGFCAGHWNNYFDTHYEHNGEPATAAGYVNDVFTDKALAFIEKHQDQPFFCYIPYNTPHSPFQVPDVYFDKHKVKGLDDTLACVYGMCENLDDNVGRLVAALDRLGLRENTILLYFGDNGPNTDRFNGGMRGQKGTTFEGGTRNILIMNGGPVPAGGIVRPITAHIDLMPTLLAYAGVTLPANLPIDGRNLQPLIARPDTDWPARDLFFHWSNRAAVRTNTHRLVLEKDKSWLFDLRSDPGETRDITAQDPALLADLQRRYNAWYEEVTAAVPLEPPPIPVGYAERPRVELLAPEGNPEGAVHYEVRAGWANDWFTGWTDTESSVYWTVNNLREGDYAVTLMYNCPAGSVGSVIEVAVGDARLRGTITEAFNPPHLPSPDRVERKEVYERTWKPLLLGSLSIPGGTSRLVVRALKKSGDTVMDLKSVVLERKE